MAGVEHEPEWLGSDIALEAQPFCRRAQPAGLAVLFSLQVVLVPTGWQLVDVVVGPPRRELADREHRPRLQAAVSRCSARARRVRTDWGLHPSRAAVWA